MQGQALEIILEHKRHNNNTTAYSLVLIHSFPMKSENRNQNYRMMKSQKAKTNGNLV